MEIDSVERAMTILQQIIDNDRDVEAEDFKFITAPGYEWNVC